jgi:hypothetical protein
VLRSLTAFLMAASLTPSAAPQEVRLTLTPYFRDLRTVQVTVGQQQRRLLFDTGGGATVISPSTAASIGCVPHGRDVGHRMTGETVVFKRCEEATMASGTWRRKFSPVGVFDVAALLPPELPPLDGVLSLDAFAGQVVTIDWNAGSIRVWPRRSEPKASGALPLRIATGESGRFLTAFVPVTATRGLLWLLLDSGNLRGTLVAQSVIDDGLLPLLPDGRARLKIGTGHDIDTSYTATALDIDGVLGTDYFKRRPVTLDLRGAAVPRDRAPGL